MKVKTPPVTDYDKPVAYDDNGQPLYAHPPVESDILADTNQSQTISEETKSKHDQSVKAFPDLSLSESEYVVSSIGRHPIGLFLPIAVGIFLIALAFIFIFNYDLIALALHLSGSLAKLSTIITPVLVFVGLVIIGVYTIYYVYTSNQMYLTNESVIQEIQYSVFSKREQTVSLESIEDASYTQTGIMQQIFNYGSIRLSTVGDETTYRFSYVSHPKTAVAVLNDAVESFKNDRPVE
jgi:hypothetical protein